MTRTVRTSGPGFTKVPHSLARDPRLSNGARGLAVQMLSHADGFRSDEEFLAGCSPDSRNAVRKQLAELRELGYLVRERVRGEDGKVTTQSVLYDVSQLPGSVEESPEPSRQEVASRSDQGRFVGDGKAPATPPWRDGATSKNVEESQIAPTRRRAAGRSDQEGQDVPAGRTDSPPPGAQSEEQKEIRKEISHSARVREAVRWLRAEYGLTDSEAVTVWGSAESRAAEPVRHPVRYLQSMRQDPVTGEIKADLADIVAAVQAASAPPLAAVPGPAAEPAPERPMPPVQPPILAAVQDDSDTADADADENGIDTAEALLSLREQLAEINQSRSREARSQTP